MAAAFIPMDADQHEASANGRYGYTFARRYGIGRTQNITSVESAARHIPEEFDTHNH
jgi:hypothetical protein